MSERITEARARLAVITDDDQRDERIDPRYLGVPGCATTVAPSSIVLLHGLTNAPPRTTGSAPQRG